ncbi:hypothetical protein HZC21_06580 [Candidatus Peregrinibacteria bacterium]|nr:hypothetical protein [Candidatus Peregrinibacteria bacterium]
MKNFKKFWKLGKKEFNTEYFSINKDGELIIHEGNYQYNVYDLAHKFGSAIEIFMPFVIEERLNHLQDVFTDNIKHLGYKGKFTYHYPMKVNQNKEVVLPLISEGSHLEVGSSNELWLVKKLWEEERFHSKIRVLCNGPKTEKYLQLIAQLRENNLAIMPIIEDIEELRLLKGFKGDVGIRVNLQSKVQSHWDHKIDRYGLTADEIAELGKLRNLKILHYHIGSYIKAENDLIICLKEAFRTYAHLKKHNPSLDTIDLGGGFAVPYEKKKMYSVESTAKRIITTLRDSSEQHGIPHPNIIVEWGRYITAPAQISVFKVIMSKEILKGTAKKWYVIDGSFMTDLLDTWAIHQKWHIIPINNMTAQKRHKVWLAGLSCDSDDKYTASDGYVLLPRLEDLSPGDDQYIAIFDTGAYQDAFAMHHCLLSSPAKIVLQNGIVTIARKRETPEEVGKMFGW